MVLPGVGAGQLKGLPGVGWSSSQPSQQLLLDPQLSGELKTGSQLKVKSLPL